MLVEQDGGAKVLTEAPADNELQLQELVKDNPDLIPVEEFGFPEPVLVVGRETNLPSGAVDLACVTKLGDLLIIEFKTGPQNSDFRHALSQLLDYGSHLWEQSYEAFETTVCSRYFASHWCTDSRLQNRSSLIEAAASFWPDFSDEDQDVFRSNLERQLSHGSFTYILVAQRFTQTVLQTVEYLNAMLSGPRLYAVELVRFLGDGVSSFESRMVLGPRPKPPQGPTNEVKVLNSIESEPYRSAMRDFFEACRALGLTMYWGTVGVSLRAPTAEQGEPISVAWWFPPGRSGWMGLRDLTLGFDSAAATAKSLRATSPKLDAFVESVAGIPGAEAATAKDISGYRLAPDTFLGHRDEVVDILGRVIREVQ